MSRYSYTPIDPERLDPKRLDHAARVLAKACYQLDVCIPAACIRWYCKSERAAEYALTSYGRELDVPDERHLAGWFLQPGWIAVRADQPLHDIGLTVAHEVHHAWSDAHAKPLDEDGAEAFARRLVATLGEAA